MAVKRGLVFRRQGLLTIGLCRFILRQLLRRKKRCNVNSFFPQLELQPALAWHLNASADELAFQFLAQAYGRLLQAIGLGEKDMLDSCKRSSNDLP